MNYPSLPRRAIPQTWEDLASFISRTARCMGYEHPQWILQPDGSDHRIRETSLPLLSSDEDYTLLEQLLSLDRATIYELTMHHIVSMFPADRNDTSTHQRLMRDRSGSKDNVLKQYFLPLSHIRVCPVCLQEDDAYDRLYWRMQYAFLCPRHRSPLLEHCPICQEVIRPFRPQLWRCPNCGQSDYRFTTSSPFDEGHILYLGELLFLHKWGIILPEWNRYSEQLTACQLVLLSPAHYMHLLQTIFSSFVQTFSWKELLLMNISLGTLSVEEIPKRESTFSAPASAFMLFHTIFTEWPARFFAFLDLLYTVSQPPFTGVEKTAMVSYCQRLFYDPWQPEAYSWLRCAYSQHLHAFPNKKNALRHTRQQVNAWEHCLYDKSAHSDETDQHPRPDYILAPSPITPYPWENLPSVLSRVARKMHIAHPDDLAQPAFTPYHPFFEEGMSFFFLKQYPQLEYFLQLGSEAIKNLTLHRFASRLQITSRRTMYTFVIDDLFSPASNTMNLCPQCLSEGEAYDRLYWNVRGVLVCPQHHILLVNTCPTCGKSIPALRLEEMRCPCCQQGDYRAAAKTPITQESILSISSSLLLHHLGISLFEEKDHPRMLACSPLLKRESGEYFHLILTFAQDVLADCSESMRMDLLQELLSPDEPQIFLHKEILIRTGSLPIVLSHAIFTKWPARFLTFLDLFYLKTTHSPYQCFEDRIAQYRRLFAQTFGKPAYSWLFDAFEEHAQVFRTTDCYLQRQAGRTPLSG